MKKPLYKSWSLLLKVAIFGLLIWSIYRQLILDYDKQKVFLELSQNWNIKLLYYLIPVVLMGVFNWWLEALKWKRLLQPIEKLSTAKAMKAIFCGLTLAFFTPNRVGDFGGRVLILKSANRAQGIALTLLGSWTQLIASLSLGILGASMYLISFKVESQALWWGLLLPFGILLIGFWVFLYHLKWLNRWFSKNKWFNRYQAYINPVINCSVLDLNYLLLLSALRHLTYSGQFLILLLGFGIMAAKSQLFILILTIYLVQTIIPSIALIELGVRGKLALHFLGTLSISAIGILSATYLLWMINLLIPAVLGAILLINLNFENH